MRFAQTCPATVVGAALLTTVAACSQPAATTSAIHGTAPPAPAPLAPAVAPVVDVPDLEAQIARQLREQVGGRWSIDCPGVRLASASTGVTCSARDRSGLSAEIAVRLSGTGAYTWRVTESAVGAASVERTTDGSR